RGSDSRGNGGIARPYRTPQKLLASLTFGQTRWLRPGRYNSLSPVTPRTTGVTLQSYPGERATLRGRLWVLGDGTTVRDLNLDGSCPIRHRCTTSGIPSPLVNARVVRLMNNDIQDRHTGICVSATTYRGVSPDLLVIAG